MFDEWRRERAIRKVLRCLSRQRVAMILQPGNVWVVELAPSESSELDPILRTCHLRGWVEPIANAVPRGRLAPNGGLPEGRVFDGEAPIYRLTEGGWQALNRTHHWVVFTAVIATITFVATIVAIVS
jgi:hypothetical protein